LLRAPAIGINCNCQLINISKQTIELVPANTYQNVRLPPTQRVRPPAIIKATKNDAATTRPRVCKILKSLAVIARRVSKLTSTPIDNKLAITNCVENADANRLATNTAATKAAVYWNAIFTRQVCGTLMSYGVIRQCFPLRLSSQRRCERR